MEAAESTYDLFRQYDNPSQPDGGALNHPLFRAWAIDALSSSGNTGAEKMRTIAELGAFATAAAIRAETTEFSVMVPVLRKMKLSLVLIPVSRDTATSYP